VRASEGAGRHTRDISTRRPAHANLTSAVTIEPPDPYEHRARVLDVGDVEDHAFLTRLSADSRIVVIDTVVQQKGRLADLRPPPPPEVFAEPTRWAYYPWRRSVVAILGPRGYRFVRLDRNRNLISAADQERLATLCVGVVGLSVGHAVAHTVALQGLCGAMRLADFDDLDLTNLNRVPGTMFDLGINKAIVAARRIAEVDPYLPVDVMVCGLTLQSIEQFLDGVDIVVEECDSFEMKALVRQAARARRLPVLMATSDRGLVDVERFDLQPDRPIFHGLLGDVDKAGFNDLSGVDKVSHLLRLIDASGLSARAAASLIEIGHTLSTWPQLAGDVAVGAGAIAEAIRRIGLGETLPSGRARLDVAAALRHLDDPLSQPVSTDHRQLGAEPVPVEPNSPAEFIAAVATRAPSGGNAQPWHVEFTDQSVTVRLAPEYTSTMDVGLRASAAAVGAAVFNARVAAAAHGLLGPVTISECGNGSPLCAVLSLTGNDQPKLSRLLEPMLDRETNRHRGTAEPLTASVVTQLESVVADEGARLNLLTETRAIQACARILGESDRIRYLTPKLHAEMVAELRWPGEASPDSGIDVRSLELDADAWALVDILRRSDVMAELRGWDGGAALAADTRARVAESSAVAVVCVRGHTLFDYARGGSAMEAVWIVAQQNRIAVQPISPVFLYAQNDDEVRSVSPTYAAELTALRHQFDELVGLSPEESAVLVLRMFHGPRPAIRSRRRPLDAARRGTARLSLELP
jgi:molybdopterin/thiamine biosynthesis adenylyltransferase